MEFGEAIKALKDGKKVAREGWNGKGMWIVLMPALQLPPHSTQESGTKVNDRTAKHIGVDTPLDSQPYIAMWTAAKQWQPGWLASQADILADDWVTMDEENAQITPDTESLRDFTKEELFEELKCRPHRFDEIIEVGNDFNFSIRYLSKGGYLEGGRDNLPGPATIFIYKH